MKTLIYDDDLFVYFKNSFRPKSKTFTLSLNYTEFLELMENKKDICGVLTLNEWVTELPFLVFNQQVFVYQSDLMSEYFNWDKLEFGPYLKEIEFKVDLIHFNPLYQLICRTFKSAVDLEMGLNELTPASYNSLEKSDFIIQYFQESRLKKFTKSEDYYIVNQNWSQGQSDETLDELRNSN